MGNALFRKLFHSALMNEAAGAEASGTGGGAHAASDTAAAAEGSASAAGEESQPGTDGNGEGQPGEKKPDGENKDDQKPAGEEGKKDDKPEGAPEKYEFTAGEGQELDTAALEQFEPIARELNLTNEQAQKMVDLYGTKIMPMVQQQQAEAWQKTTEQWAADVKADKEIGGDKLTANLSSAQRALKQFGSPELKEYLNGTGLGNHPELVKTFIKIGKAMSEDGMVDGSNQGQRSAAEVLYGK